MRVLNVNSSLDFKTGGGTAERTFQMSRFLAMQGISCVVLTIDTGLDEARTLALKPAQALVTPLIWRRFYVPRISRRAIQAVVEEADVIHLMGHWSILNALVYMVLRRAGKPYVVCPAGALPIFGRSGWLKKIYNRIIGNSIIGNASGWIAVTLGELPHFESYGISSSKITIIPNGVCEDKCPGLDTAAFRSKNGLSAAPVILFMGRLNPIKGPDLLLQAFVLIKDRIPDHQLVFAGPDEGMQAGLASLAQLEGVGHRVHFLGYVSGADKLACYHMASVLVVPSRQEAMSIVALEAGVCGTPVLLTDQCGFGDIKTIDEILETSADALGIARSLVQILTEPGFLARVGPAFREFIVQRYTWNSIVFEYIRMYQSILTKAAKK